MDISYVDWLRKKIGTRKVFLPFSSVVARDEHGRILLQRRTDFDFWGLPGGVLELDEDLETCARMGSVAAAYCLEQNGPRGHSFTPTELVARYRQYFDDQGLLDVFLNP